MITDPMVIYLAPLSPITIMNQTESGLLVLLGVKVVQEKVKEVKLYVRGICW